jgi:hypothetical protein
MDGSGEFPTSGSDGVETVELLADSVDIWEILSVGEGGEIVGATNGVDFGASLLLYLGIEYHDEKEHVQYDATLRCEINTGSLCERWKGVPTVSAPPGVTRQCCAATISVSNNSPEYIPAADHWIVRSSSFEITGSFRRAET